VDEQEFMERADTELRMMIEKSAIVMHIIGAGPPTVKSAVEVGFALLLDKPIIVVVPEDRPVPDHLRNIAVAVIPLELEPSAMADRIQETMDRVYPGRFGGKDA
jgi:hypothetical protein